VWQKALPINPPRVRTYRIDIQQMRPSVTRKPHTFNTVFPPIITPARLFEQPPIQVIAIGIDQKCDEQEHARHLRILHELVAGFAPCNDFIQEEKDVSAIQCRDG